MKENIKKLLAYGCKIKSNGKVILFMQKVWVVIRKIEFGCSSDRELNTYIGIFECLYTMY